MAVALGVLVSVFAGLLVVGGLSGRVRVKSCCAVADPRRDLRMRAAFADEAPSGTSDRATSTGDPDRT